MCIDLNDFGDGVPGDACRSERLGRFCNWEDSRSCNWFSCVVKRL